MLANVATTRLGLDKSEGIYLQFIYLPGLLAQHDGMEVITEVTLAESTITERVITKLLGHLDNYMTNEGHQALRVPLSSN